MKKFFLSALFLSLFFLISIDSATAQIPRVLNYQGLALDNTGKPISDGNHVVQFNLYSAPTGGTALFTESIQVIANHGIFSATIGAGTPIPAAVKFDNEYFLSIAIDGGAELAPRTPMTAAPYALNAASAVTALTANSATSASIADSAKALTANAIGVVRTLNGRSGNILIEGVGATKVTTVGSTISINVPVGTGNGIQGVSPGDTSIAVTSSVGPVAGVSVAPLGINHSKIAPNAITNVNIMDTSVSISKLTAQGVTKYYVVSSDGNGNAVWQQPILQMPYTAIGANPSGSVFTVANTGSTGTTIRGLAGTGAGLGIVTTAAIWGDAGTNYNGVVGYSDGGSSSFSGVQGRGNNSSNGVSGIAASGNAVTGLSTSGRAGYFQTTNSSNSANTLEASNAGSGDAIRGASTADGITGVHGQAFGQANSLGVLGETFSADAGTGVLTGPTGVFGKASSTSPASWSAGVRGINPSTNGSGIGVAGYQAGSGWGVYGETPSGNAVYGKATNTSATNNGVVGETVSPNGAGVKASYTGSSVGIALQVNNGAIKVTGTNKCAFVQTVTVANKITATDTEIDNPICDGDATAILFITNQVAAGNISNKNPVAVIYNSTTGHWQIENINGTALTTGTLFNVLVIKQ